MSSDPIVLQFLDIKCQRIILEVAHATRDLPSGKKVVIRTECLNFPEEIRWWCNRFKHTVLSVVEDGEGIYTVEVIL